MPVKKTYRIEVPMYAYSIRHLTGLKRRNDNIEIIIYGGVPDSPLNGGRPNFILDGLLLFDRLFFSLNERQLSRLMSKFYRTLEEANKAGIPFFFACTNLFIDENELTEKNLSPFKKMEELGRKYGLKNGVIVNNKLLEDYLRRTYGDRFIYVSSCTKYVSPVRVLSYKDTLQMYIEDSRNYDFVVMTPQDSQKEGSIKQLIEAVGASKVLTISNAYCGCHCNSYYHYEYTSKINKETLVGINSMHIVKDAFKFSIPKLRTCPVPCNIWSMTRCRRLAAMQVQSGVVNFKLGRGMGQGSIGKIISLIKKQESGSTINV
jgi:hypothetical protein